MARITSSTGEPGIHSDVLNRNDTVKLLGRFEEWEKYAILHHAEILLRTCLKSHSKSIIIINYSRQKPWRGNTQAVRHERRVWWGLLAEEDPSRVGSWIDWQCCRKPSGCRTQSSGAWGDHEENTHTKAVQYIENLQNIFTDAADITLSGTVIFFCFV